MTGELRLTLWDLSGGDPLVEPIPNNVSWDDAEQEIEYSFFLPANGDPISIFFELPFGACRGLINLGGFTEFQGGCLDIGEERVVAGIPQPPTEPHLVALNWSSNPGPFGFDERHVVTFEPGVDADWQTQLCLPGNLFEQIAVGPSGDVWVSPAPVLSYDPTLLTFSSLDERRFVEEMNGPGAGDSVRDPAGASVLFSTTELDPSTGIGSVVIKRYDPVTDQFDVFYQNSTLASAEHGVFDRDGRYVFSAFDPVAAPGLTTTLRRLDGIVEEGVDPGFEDPNALDIAVDADGNYVILPGFYPPDPGNRTPLVWVDATEPEDEVPEEIVNLDAAFPTVFLWEAAQVHPNTNDIYLAPGSKGLAVVRDDGSTDWVIPHDPLATTGLTSKMRFTAPEPGGLPSILVGLAALAGWARRRVRLGRDEPQRSSWRAYRP